MKQTPLYANHLQLKAKIVEFAGWQMPIQYTSLIEEHLFVRQHAGLFDVSHMAVVDITGEAALPFLQTLLANDIRKLNTPGTALYSVMLNEAGGVIDDLIVYYVSPNVYRMVVNAGCCDKDMAWIETVAASFQVSVVLNRNVAMLALQGPAFETVWQTAFPDLKNNIPSKPFSFVIADDLFIARTGYTGEAGIEIILPNEKAEIVWEALLAAGAKAIGLGARDTLRLEAGLNLYGHEMDETVSPWEANLAWTLALNDRDFIGKTALLKAKAAGIQHQLVGVVLPQGGVLRALQKIETNLGEGVITSGTFSPFLKVAIGMARVPVGCDPTIQVIIRDKKCQARCVALPFVKKGKATYTI